MKKLVVLSLLLSVGIVFSLTSCTGKIGGTVKGETITTEGWIDNDTFRLQAMGVPNSKLKNIVQRKASSKRAAILNAQYQVLEKFKGSKIEGAAGMSDFESTGIAIAQEVSGIVKGGSVKKITWDEQQNAEIIYEVKAKGLKKKVSGAEWK